MSKVSQSPVHLEWSTAGVRAVNIVTHETAEAASLAGLGPLGSGPGSVLIGIGRRDVFLKAVRLPKADPDDLRRILSVQLGTLFPLPAEHLAFDFFQTADVNAEGCLTVVGAMRSDDLRRLEAELKAAGLTVTRILPVSLAAPAVAASAGQSDALVAETGPAGLALDVVRGGIVVFSRIVPSASDAECEVTRTLSAANARALPVVSAGVAGLPDALPSLGTSLTLLHEAPAFSFQLAEERARESQKRVGDRTRLAVLLLVSALLLMALVWADRQQAQAAATRRQGVQARQLTRLRSIKNAETVKAQNVQAVQDITDRAFKPAQPLGDIVAVVADALPKSAWLSGLSVERGKTLQLRGTTTAPTDVPQIVQTLGTDSRFRDVHLVFANSVTLGKAKLVEFDVSAVCVGNLPLAAPDKTTASSPASADQASAGGTAE